MPSKTNEASSSELKRSSSTLKKKQSDSLLKATQTSVLIDNLMASTSGCNSRKSDGKRKSLPCNSDSQSTNDGYISDDGEIQKEREELYNALATEKSNLGKKKVAEGGIDKKKKSGNFLSTIGKKMTSEELDAHYSHCIDFFSRNKVNTKNAFKLQLIDCMRMFMDKKSEKCENLALMSCTLDASAKIYSCRVDNVYTNMIKFIKNYQLGIAKSSKPNIDNQDNDDEESQDKASDDETSDKENTDQASKKKKDKKKRNLKSFIKERDSMNRTEVEKKYYRQNLPRNQNYFLESSVLDEGYELCPNRPLFVSPAVSTQSIELPQELVEKLIPWTSGPDKDNFDDKIPGYKDLRSKIFLADDGPEDERSVDMDNSFTFDPSIERIAEIRPFGETCDGQSSVDGGDLGDPGEVEVDYDDCDTELIDVAGGVDSPLHDANSEVSALSGRLSVPPSSVGDSESLPSTNLSTPRVSFTPIAMSRMLRSANSKHSDYSYFDNSKLEFMPSAAHWKIKPPKRSIAEVGKTPGKAKKGKSMYINFSTDRIGIDVEAIQSVCKITSLLSIKTTKDWFYNKTNLIFLPIITHARRDLLSFFKDLDTCILKVVKNSESTVDDCDVNESLLLNPQDFASSDNESIDDDRGDDDHPGDYHPLEDWSEKMDAVGQNDNKLKMDAVGQNDNELKKADENDISDNSDKNRSSETPDENGDLLVPAPLRVEKVVVEYAKAQKRIDIKKLKTAIWDLMDLEDTSLVNNDEGSSFKEVQFSDIYARIPENISREAAAELSFPIGFMAILHMANEKTLRLRGNGDQTDFTVMLDTEPSE